MSAALVALLLTAVFITPGMLYRYERNIRCSVPVRRRQRLLLAPATLAIGFAAVAAALWVFAIIRWILPAQTPNVGELLRDFGSYSRDNLPVLGAWATGVYGAALLLAFLSARILPERQSDDDIDVSSWQYVSHHKWSREYGDRPHLVRVALESGEVVEGSLFWYSTDTAEVADRDLVLTYARYLGPPPAHALPLSEQEHMIIPASRMRYLTITYQ
ncbi:DUF6338 family protein [Candidatus Poriferisodalis sp.]|uniref:DUF6338 family protein n=1 Tax=Candidatus Poriferisodalis sp. TaxID=3101277 RepID=UPI003D10696F